MKRQHGYMRWFSRDHPTGWKGNKLTYDPGTREFTQWCGASGQSGWRQRTLVFDASVHVLVHSGYKATAHWEVLRVAPVGAGAVHPQVPVPIQVCPWLCTLQPSRHCLSCLHAHTPVMLTDGCDGAKSRPCFTGRLHVAFACQWTNLPCCVHPGPRRHG